MKAIAKLLIDKTEVRYGLPTGKLMSRTANGRPAKAYNDVSLSELRKALSLYMVDHSRLSVTEAGNLLEIDHSSVSYLYLQGRALLKNQDEKFISYFNQVLSVAEDVEETVLQGLA